MASSTLHRRCDCSVSAASLSFFLIDDDGGASGVIAVAGGANPVSAITCSLVIGVSRGTIKAIALHLLLDARPLPIIAHCRPNGPPYHLSLSTTLCLCWHSILGPWAIPRGFGRSYSPQFSGSQVPQSPQTIGSSVPRNPVRSVYPKDIPSSHTSQESGKTEMVDA